MPINFEILGKVNLIALLFVLTGILVSGSVSAKQLFAVGNAYSPNGQLLLYVEKHYFSDPHIKGLLQAKQIVVYHEPTGEIFAEKILDFSHNPVAPSFQQHNNRVGERIEVKNTKDRKLNLSYQKATDHKPKTKELKQSENMVIDAGFDNLVRSQWEALNTDQTLSFEYLVPSMRRTIKLDIKKANCESELVCFHISPSNHLLSFFTGNLELQYNPETKRLTNFKGKGNIAGSDGKYQQVHIRYQYF